jgi:hypothetical protein
MMLPSTVDGQYSFLDLLLGTFDEDRRSSHFNFKLTCERDVALLPHSVSSVYPPFMIKINRNTVVYDIMMLTVPSTGSFVVLLLKR